MNYIAVIEHGENCCHLGSDRPIVRAAVGYLANSVTLDTGCGSTDCAWQLQTSEGKRLNISIYDFGICKYLTGMCETGYVSSYLYSTGLSEDRYIENLYS